jgi:hypothetical protein
MTKATITINGRIYDAITGMPVVTPASNAATAKPAHQAPAKAAPQSNRAFSDVAPTRHPHAPAQAIHKVTQKSHTLYRKALQKPAAKAVTTAPAQKAHERSPLISKFQGGHTGHVTQPEPVADTPIAPAVVHPSVAKALQTHAAATAPKQHLSGSDLKEQLIKERLAEVGDRPERDHKKTSWLSRQPRLVTILSSTLALLVLGGYLTYITLPSISLRVAASRAGVNANMPEYKPDGYRLDGPITYSPGEVVISYKSNTNEETGYKLVQKATNWDSQAVLDNYVAKLTDNYLTFQERGVTVYTFGNKAAWVNGGLLYTIDGNAGLSSDQILRVATSL